MVVSIGDNVKAGDILGTINIPVLRSFKGRPMVMLHLELMKHGSRNNEWWSEFDMKPPSLLDPTPFLVEAAGSEAEVFDLSHYDGISFIDPKAERKPSSYWNVWGGSV